MASFDIAYNKYIKPNEGGYVNDPVDKGGETYAGIARNFHPNWSGWSYIDFIKKTKGPIARNAKLPDVQAQVDEFYRAWWDSKLFGQINSQEVANLLFDFNVNSGSAIKIVQRIVGVTADGAMGPNTIAAINKANPSKLHAELKAARKSLYDSLVAKDPTQQKFYAGWINRLSKFPDLVAVGITGLGIIIAIVGIVVVLSMDSKPQNKQTVTSI